MASDEKAREFVHLLALSQRPLYAFIRAQVQCRADADEILQQTSTVLWEKFEAYDRTRSFIAWACGIAWREVLSHRRDCRRRKLLLDDALGDVLAARFAAAAERVDERLDSLRECMALLKPDSRRLIERRYYNEEDVEKIATRAGASASSIYKSLTRLRRVLLDCVAGKLKEEF
jgi:RNA polymerase sigma-70 factor, ECF subfamily